MTLPLPCPLLLALQLGELGTGALRASGCAAGPVADLRSLVLFRIAASSTLTELRSLNDWKPAWEPLERGPEPRPENSPAGLGAGSPAPGCSQLAELSLMSSPVWEEQTGPMRLVSLGLMPVACVCACVWHPVRWHGHYSPLTVPCVKSLSWAFAPAPCG